MACRKPQHWRGHQWVMEVWKKGRSKDFDEACYFITCAVTAVVPVILHVEAEGYYKQCRQEGAITLELVKY